MGPGKLWDDLGSTPFVTDKTDTTKTTPSTRNAKRRELRRKIDESSDDELDFLSSSSRSDDLDQLIPTKSKPRTKKKQPGKAVIRGGNVDHHPDNFPKKLPDFKKIVNAVQEESSSTSRSKSSSTTKDTLNQTTSYAMLATLHDDENGRHSWPSDVPLSDKDSLVDHTDLSNQVSSQRHIQVFPGLALSPLRPGDQGSSHYDTPRGSTEGLISYGQSKPVHGKRHPQSPSTNNRPTPASRRASRAQSSDSSDSSEATPRAKHPKNSSRKFPTLDPLSTSDPMVPELDGGRGEASYKATTSRTPSQTHRNTSDTTTPRKNRKSRYPFPSPLSSPPYQPSQESATALRKTNHRSTLNVMTDEDADDEYQKRKLQPRPFPMAASQSKPTHRTPRRNIAFTEQTCPDNDRCTILSDSEVFGDDSLLMEEVTDPSNLCPFCDEKLPPNPSPLYRSLLEAARRKAYPDPRPTNPRGLKAQMGVYVASCKRHRFEVHQIPEAIAKGWPTDINFGKVRKRVEKLRDGLTKLVRDEDNAREKSIYWTTLIAEVRKLGSRAASGVKGQFESFEKTQPGYYGELGSMILHQTLYNMFPPSSFDPQFIAPLAPQEFIQRILVPEAAVTLIMEDTGQDRVTAVQTMRESAGYGVAMFPDTSEGPEVGAGEDIVLERARARRRELEDEERIEALLFSGNSEDENLNQTKGTKRSKMSNSGTTTDIEEIATARRKMKRKKAGSRTDTESGPDGHAFRGAEPPPCISLSKSQPPYPWTSSPEPQEFTPKPKSTLNNQRTSDGRSMSAPIDVDAPQIIDGTDLPSVFGQQPPVQVDGMAPIVQGSSDTQKLGTYGDLPNPRSKARERIVVRDSSVDRRLGQNELVSLSMDQDQRRDSSVEILEPPTNCDRLPRPRRETPDSPTTFTDDSTGRVHRRARRYPTVATTSSPKHDRHDWLMNDSD